MSHDTLMISIVSLTDILQSILILVLLLQCSLDTKNHKDDDDE